MCRLGTKDSHLFAISDIELQRTGPSYTIDTVRELRKLGLDQISWLIGADMLMYLPHWHRAAELIQEVEFIIMARPQVTLDWQALPPEYRRLRDNVVEAPLIEISASDIRKRAAAGLSIDFLTPEAVCRYIRERRLYR